MPGTETVTTAAPLTAPYAATMDACPAPTAVTTPDALTVATAGLRLRHVTLPLASGLPAASVPLAVSACVEPTPLNSTPAGATRTVFATSVTVTGTLALAPAFAELVRKIRPGGVIPHYGSTDYAKIVRTNRALAELCAARPGAEFLDYRELLLERDGRLREEAFAPDGLHFTPEFYRRWAAWLLPKLGPGP